MPSVKLLLDKNTYARYCPENYSTRGMSKGVTAAGKNAEECTGIRRQRTVPCLPVCALPSGELFHPRHVQRSNRREKTAEESTGIRRQRTVPCLLRRIEMIRRWMSIALFLTLLAAGCVPASAAGALRAGDRVQIGYYEQNNNDRNGQEPIWWDVLETSGDRALLISSQALDCMEYYHRNTAVAWRNSTIRNWLMGVFYY